MASRFLALAVVILLLGVVSSSPIFVRSASAATTWYVGQGAKENTYVTYTVQEYDTNQDRPFQITIYFEKQASDGSWTAPTFVVDQGAVYNATLKLGSNLSILRGGNDSIPPEMNPYLGAYARTLQWLSAFSPQASPQSLTAISWGKIACIGCGTLDPSGTEKVNEPSGTFDTYRLVNHRGQHDSILWVNPDQPYPVKALTYADVTSGQPPIQFAFDLTAMGTGKPAQPVSHLEAPQPPQTLTTDAGNYKITLDWNPASIQSGNTVAFTIHFTDIAGNPVSNVNYEFTVLDDKMNMLVDLKDQNSDPNGAATQQVKFNQSGSAQVKVTINGVAGVPTGEFVEQAKFGLLVVPEFPIGVAVLAGITLAIMIVLMRSGFAGNLISRSKGLI